MQKYSDDTGGGKNMRPKIDRPVIVEGKYDKLRLLSIFDAVVLTTDGFGVFRSEEKKLLIGKARCLGVNRSGRGWTCDP